jgi:hypothetical protein
MSNYSTENVLKGRLSAAATEVEAGASATTVLSEVFRLSSRDAEQLLIDVEVSAITSTTAITLVLQDSTDLSTWNNQDTLVVTTTGRKSLAHFAAAANPILRPYCRLVVTTDTSDAITVTSVIRTSRAG